MSIQIETLEYSNKSKNFCNKLFLFIRNCCIHASVNALTTPYILARSRAKSINEMQRRKRKVKAAQLLTTHTKFM